MEYLLSRIEDVKKWGIMENPKMVYSHSSISL